MKEKLKNPVLWGSILSTIFLILSALGIINISDQVLNTIINSILSILALVGIINSPKENKDYISTNSNNNIQDDSNDEAKNKNISKG